MNTKTFRVEIFLVALAAILLEISYTRVFSFKLFYYFTYLTIGIVLLGMGSGGVSDGRVGRTVGRSRSEGSQNDEREHEGKDWFRHARRVSHARAEAGRRFEPAALEVVCCDREDAGSEVLLPR